MIPVSVAKAQIRSGMGRAVVQLLVKAAQLTGLWMSIFPCPKKAYN